MKLIDPGGDAMFVGCVAIIISWCLWATEPLGVLRVATLGRIEGRKHTILEFASLSSDCLIGHWYVTELPNFRIFGAKIVERSFHSAFSVVLVLNMAYSHYYHAPPKAGKGKQNGGNNEAGTYINSGITPYCCSSF